MQLQMVINISLPKSLRNIFIQDVPYLSKAISKLNRESNTVETGLF